jgi:hypothetical protein
MSKLFPIHHEIVRDDTRNESFTINRVRINNSTSNFVNLGYEASDAALLQQDRTTADPTFYLSNRNTIVNIDGATVGSEQVIVARHRGSTINFNRGDRAVGDGQ